MLDDGLERFRCSSVTTLLECELQSLLSGPISTAAIEHTDEVL